MRTWNLLLALASLWFSRPNCFGDVLINLDATQLPTGPLATWVNTGTLPGNFTSAGTVVPSVATVAGAKGIAFIGGTGGGDGTHYLGPAAPAAVTAGASRTIEAWVYNPSAQGEETVFAWGRRGGNPDGSNCSFGHGTDASFGAVGHWGGPDIGWNGQIDFNRWSYIVYTYDSATLTTTVYKDGAQANIESGITLNTHAVDTAGNPLRFRVARQNLAGGGPSAVGVGGITIARVRVHDQVLEADTIAATYETERCGFGLCDDDSDGIPNGYEQLYPACLNPNDPTDVALDCDSDGLTNLQEFQGGTLPNNADTDGDGASDGAEVNRMKGGNPAPTNPLQADTDGDGLRDGAETDTGMFVSATNTGTDPLLPDTDGDGFIDGHEVLRSSNPTDNASKPNLSLPGLSPLISLDAATLPAGPLAVWPNTGALPGDFAGSPVANPPQVNTIQFVKGVTLDGVNNFYTGPATPQFVTGNSAASIEAWLYNPAAADEETVFAWGRRGGPDGSNMSFNHGLNALFGAVGHWGGPDLGWNGNIAAGRWTYVVYTYDPSTGEDAVYQDGALANSETVGVLNVFATDTAGNPLRFRVGSQNEADGSATAGLRGSMTIARLRVYEVPLDATTIMDNYAREGDEFGVTDADSDGIPTWYERLYPAFLNPNEGSDAAMDFDQDGLTNLEEYQNGSAPDKEDTDGDGVLDGAEVHRMVGGNPAPTNPLRADTDQDGLSDRVETGTGMFVSAMNTGSDPLVVDSDGDGFADGQEIIHQSDPNSAASTPDFSNTSPVAIINLDATGLNTGPLADWPNTGALGGMFQAGGQVASVTTVNNVNGVTLSGTDQYYTGPVTPVYMTADNSRTVEAWIYNPSAADEETVFAWGRRGGPDGSNCAFNHGTNPTFGAVGHWGAADLGWNGSVTEGKWTHVAYTFNKTDGTAAVYGDGQLANSGARALNTWAVDGAPAMNPLPFRLGAQTDANGTVTAALMGSMTIGRLRVYDEALPATGDDSIEAHYLAEVNTFNPPRLLSIQVDRAAGTTTLNWEAILGLSYTIEASSNLRTWMPRATGITTGSYTDDEVPMPPVRFYRLLVE